MKSRFINIVKLFFVVIVLIFSICFSNAASTGLKVVGLYSETTEAAYISYRTGNASWIVIKIGDLIPDNAEISVSVDRDWVELTPSGNPNTVYEILGSEKGIVIKKVSDILKGKPKLVSFPKTGDKPDPKFTNKMIVKQYLGRQMYRKDDKSSWVDIKYGDILDTNGTVNIIAINNTIDLVFSNAKTTQVVGPLKFKIEKLLKGENLYKPLKG
jgi:hypothetical protein